MLLSQHSFALLSNAIRKCLSATNAQNNTLQFLHNYVLCFSYSKSNVSNVFVVRYSCLSAEDSSGFNEKSANSKCQSPKRELLVRNVQFYNYCQTAHFSTEFVLPERYRIEQADSFKCDHPDCGGLIAFISRQHLDTHMKKCHSADEYRCDFCEQIFSQKKLLTAHMKLVHKGDFKFVCDICTKKFRVKNQLNRHLLRHKNETENLKLFCCTHCTKRFNHQIDLSNHIRCYHDAPSFQCNFVNCGKVFRQMNQLRRHVVTHDDSLREHRCSFDGCNWAFTNKFALRGHIQQVHQQVERQFVCDFAHCGKTFHSEHNLNQHKIVHIHGKARPSSGRKPPLAENQPKTAQNEEEDNGNKRSKTSQEGTQKQQFFKCNYPGCAKTFPRKNHLTQHEWTHSNERQFACRFCPKMFVSGKSQRLHEFLRHQDRYLSCEKVGAVDV